MSVVRSNVETSISIPITNTTNLTGRVNPKTTLVCLEKATNSTSKNRYNLNRLNLDLTEPQRLHQILSALLYLAGYQSSLDQQVRQCASAPTNSLIRSTFKTLFLISKRKKNPFSQLTYATWKGLHATDRFSF